MQSILLIIHIIMALTLIGLILIQHGKGADAGAAFGSGASSTVFGSSGSASFLTRATGILAFVFFANSFFLSYLSTVNVEQESLMEKVQVTEGLSSDEEKVSTDTIEAKIAPADQVPTIESPAVQSDLPDVPKNN